jgi:hypothetical protein
MQIHVQLKGDSPLSQYQQSLPFTGRSFSLYQRLNDLSTQICENQG